MKKLITNICKNVLPLMAFFFTLPLFAQSDEVEFERYDSIVQQATLYYAIGQVNSFTKNDSLELQELITWVKENNNAYVAIQGWADISGTKAQNDRVSEARALTAKEYLVNEGVPTYYITIKGMGIDSTVNASQARRADLFAYLITKRLAGEVSAEELEQRLLEAATADEDNSASLAEPAEAEIALAAPKNELSLRTNLAYWLGSLINVGVEWNVGASPIGIVLY